MVGKSCNIPGATKGRVLAYGPRDDALHKRVGPGAPFGGLVFFRAVGGRGGILVGKSLGCGEREIKKEKEHDNYFDSILEEK